MAIGAVPYNAFGEEKTPARQSPSDRLRIGSIGVGNRNAGNTRDFTRFGDVVAICDVDSGYGPVVGVMNDPRMGFGPEGNRTPPDFYDDYRRVLDRDDIDIVVIGTPDHWHAKISAEALLAGKHVYCEKPLTLTLEENRLIRTAAQKSDRVFQVGSQQRSMRELFITAALLVRHGVVGKLKNIVCNIGSGPTCEPLMPTEIPATLNWDRWLGQAPMTEFIAGVEGSNIWRYGRCHRSFRYWYDYSGGTMTDWGAHHVDCALLAMGLQEVGTGPVSVDGRSVTLGVPFKDGQPIENNRFNTPVDFDVVFKFTPTELLADDAQMHLVSKSPDGNGILFEGTKGCFHVNRDRIKGKPAEENDTQIFADEDYFAINKGKPFEGHSKNFVRCIREGGLPASDVFTHVLAMNCCHLAGIAARLGREIRWNPVTEQIEGDEQAASFMARTPRKGYEFPTL